MRIDCIMTLFKVIFKKKFDICLAHELDGIDNNTVRAHLMKDSCEFKFNAPPANQAGDVTNTFSQKSHDCILLSIVMFQLDDKCLHAFLCEAAAIINILI